MSDWKQLFFSLIFCSLSCSIITQIAADTKTKALLRLICGMILTITILRPLSDLDPDLWLEIPELKQNPPEIYISEGEMTARIAYERRIKDSCEAYILDKAEKLGTCITAHVSLREDYVPVYIVIQGEVDPAVQTQLQAILVADLGIPKENQEWIRNQENSSS